MTVTVDDGETRATACTTCTQDVTITVMNVLNAEAPLAPAAPTVVSGEDSDLTDDEESTTSLKVVWHPPRNMGRPSISSYEVQYKKSTETSFSIATDADDSDTTVTIPELDPDTSYDVRVYAMNSDGDSPWSFVGTGSTNKEGNSPPQSKEDSTPATRRVHENTPAGGDVEIPVTAADEDTTTLTYGLGGPDADLFNFNTQSGQIRTKAPLNHEDPRCYDDSDPNATKCRYYVTVTVVDGVGGSDATGVTIEVEDRTENPSAPARPTVRATEKLSTSLDVSWNAPANTGPDIVSYDVQYREGNDPFSYDNCGERGVDNCKE